MHEVSLINVNAVNLFPYSKSKIDTYLEVAVSNPTPCDCAGLSVDLNGDPKETATVCDESNPAYNCKDLHFVIPTAVLVPAPHAKSESASESESESDGAKHTIMTIHLMMNGTMSLFGVGGSIIGSIEIDLNILVAKHTQLHQLELEFNWKNDSIEQAYKKYIDQELETLKSCPVPGTSIESILPKLQCNLQIV